MKILIIGGTGNISSAISKGLAGREHDLTLFKKHSNVPDWLKDAHLVTGDRNDRADFERKLSALGTFDCVIDMLCYEPADAECDARVFRGRTRQFIFCSTVDVYTKRPASFPVTEENGVIAPCPSFPYAWKKAECERILWEAHRRGDFALTICRPTFSYNESWSPGIHSFGGQSYHLDRLQKGKPILMHGDGTSIWVASHRDDTATAFLGAIGNEKAFGQAYNCSGDEWMTQEYIWRTIARLMNAPEPDFACIPTDLLGKLAPLQAEWCVENFRFNNIFDNTKAKRDLGFNYTVKFEDGARRCLEYLRANNLIENCEKHPYYDRILEAWRRSRTALISEFENDPVRPE